MVDATAAVEQEFSDTLDKWASEILAALGKHFGLAKYSDSQARDDHGRWTSGGGGGGNEAQALLAASGRVPSVAEFNASLTPAQSAAIASARDRLASGIPTNSSVEQGGFVNKDGTYTAEREAVHQEILNKIFTDQAVSNAVPKAGEKPTYTMFGGRGGSGKGNLTKEGGPVDTKSAIMLNSDDIKAALPGYQGWNAALYHEESSHIFERADALARDAGLNVIHDSTMRTAATAEKYIAAYTAAGYDIKGYYMFASPGVAAQRAMDRFMNPKAWTSGGNTGRFVPPEIILRSTTNEASFDAAKSSMSNWAIYTMVPGASGERMSVKLVAKK